MKRLFTVILSAVALLGMLVPAAQAAPRELLVSSVMMETHPVIATFVLPFLKEWEKRANGTITITYFNPGTICAASDMIVSCQKGVISMTMAPLAQAPALFPTATIANMPLLFANSRSSSLSLAAGALNIPQLRQEWSQWKIIMAAASVPLNLLTVKKPIRVMEDLKGVKIAATTNDGLEVIKCLGAIPVLVQMNDMYLALQRGMVDGCILPQPTYRSTKVTEVAKYLTLCNIQTSPTPLIMSRENWDSLPEEAKKVIDDIGLMPLSIAGGMYPDYFGVMDTDWVVSNHNVQICELPAEERERWLKAVEPTHQSWIDRARRQGVENPEEVLEAMKTLAVKYNDQQEALRLLQDSKESLGSFYPPQDKIDLVWRDAS